VPPAVKKERSARLRALSAEACLARWRDKVGREDVVLVDRPGRGYGADYSPWLVEGAVGELVRVRGRAVTEEGILADAA
jgi:tRNA A37 methylthiotransferase MiaB